MGIGQTKIMGIINLNGDSFFAPSRVATTDAFRRRVDAMLEAGVDMLLCPDNLGWATEAVLYALESGRLTEARIDESALRILQLKETYGLLD